MLQIGMESLLLTSTSQDCNLQFELTNVHDVCINGAVHQELLNGNESIFGSETVITCRE